MHDLIHEPYVKINLFFYRERKKNAINYIFKYTNGDGGFGNVTAAAVHVTNGVTTKLTSQMLGFNSLNFN